jgi:hypothetical protein
MENVETTQPTGNPVTINDEIKGYLLETSKWGKFLAIVGYIGIGLLVLLGVIVMVGLSFAGSMSQFGFGFPMGLLGFIYILIAVLYWFPVNYLYKFSDNVKKGLNTNDQQHVTLGFESLKSLYKFSGILTIIVLSIYALVLLIAIPMAIFAVR